MGCNNVIWLIGALFCMQLMLAIAWCLAPWNRKGSEHNLTCIVTYGLSVHVLVVDH